MRVLHLLQSSRFSGAENVACQIIELFKDDINVEMAYCSRNGQIGETLREKNITFLPVEKFGIKDVKKIIAQYNPDVVHAHDMRACVIAVLTGTKAKIISHIHNSDFASRKVSTKSILYYLASRKCSKVIWVSNSCYNAYYFHKGLKNKSLILYNVIDKKYIEKKIKQDQDRYDLDVVYVGRLAEPKNPQRLITVSSILKNMKDDIQIGIVGTGPLEETVLNMIRDNGLNNNVHLYGFMQNPYKVLQSSKIMIMTSDREGTPMIALESMALGVPIVTTPTDGLCDLIEHGINGFLSWDENELAGYCLMLIDNPETREKFSKNISHKFNNINDIANYKRVIESCYKL